MIEPHRRHFIAVAACAVACCLSVPRAASADPKTEAAAISHVAHARATDGKWRAAAELYGQAFRVDPSELGYLRSAATSYFRAGAWDEAIDHYERWLGRAPRDASGRARLQARLQTARSKRIEARAARRQRERSAAKAEQARQRQIERIKRENIALKAAATRRRESAQPREGKNRTRSTARQSTATSALPAATWLLASATVIALGAGGYLFVDGQARGDRLTVRLGQRDAAGRVFGIDRNEALVEQDAANLRIGAGVGLMFVGLTAGGWAVYRALQGTASVSLVPGLNGASARVHF